MTLFGVVEIMIIFALPFQIANKYNAVMALYLTLLLKVPKIFYRDRRSMT